MNSFNFVDHPVSDTITLLAEYLVEIVEKNDRNIVHSYDQTTGTRYCPAYTPFHARKIPSIDIPDYLARILKYCPCTNDCLIAIMVYIERMSNMADDSTFAIDSYNIHRFIIVAIMISTKFFSDIFYTNTRYSKVGGLTVSELNYLEIEFLKLNRFNVTISSHELQSFADSLLNKTKPVLYIPEVKVTEYITPDSPWSSMDGVFTQSWSPPMTPTASEESSPIIFSSMEFRNACYLSKSYSSVDPIKSSFPGSNVDSIIRRPDNTHATSINKHSCSVPLNFHLSSFKVRSDIGTQTGEHKDSFKKLSIQSGRTYGSYLSDLMGTNANLNTSALSVS
ncbi:cyclin-like protein interacting with PHO85 [Basidiobolus ranarum]|uniref:Cyclin-like protein interacting with PHO85 n=1 Tax=Basidiobolus ranarum TaxID=34480 RepID=A0ABR2WUI4_9FUNG